MFPTRPSLLISITLIAAVSVPWAESGLKKDSAAESGPKRKSAAGSDAKKNSAAVPSALVAKPKFLSGDPLWKEPKPLPVANVKTVEINDLYDFLQESLIVPRQQKRVKRSGNSAARNANTLGEVPDSEWYTNRHALHPMTIAELVRGAGDANPPDPDGDWRVISGKSDGVMPGFVIEDSHNNKYLLKFDPPDYPELASAADVIGSKFYYAIGYNTPENYIAYFRRNQLKLSEQSYWRDPAGKKRLLTPEVVDNWMAKQPKDAQGRYRVLASRWVAGKPVGPFQFEGTRSDDPNDVIPHEYRRELRGLSVVASWLNDTDAKSINTLDSLVEEDGVTFLKHFRIDWGAALGSDSLQPKDIRRGHDYFLDPKSAGLQAATLGLYLPRWMRASYPSIRGVGAFDFESFDPVHWVPNYPVSAFLLMDNEDAFWAAKQVMSFSDSQIRAIVETGKYSDPRATDWVTECLIKRRDKIGKAWLSRGLALDNFRVDRDQLLYDDLGEKYSVCPKKSYRVEWSVFDNLSGEHSPVAAANSWSIPTGAGGRTGFLSAAIRSSEGPVESAQVTVYLRLSRDGWTVVGVDRRYE